MGLGEAYRYVKVFPANLLVLANTMSDGERLGLRNECAKFISRDPKLNQKLFMCSKTDRNWVSDYLSSGKGVISYEMIQRFNLLDIAPEKDIFLFSPA